MALQAISKKATLSDQAYEIIKDAIITGSLIPGEVLAEERLAQQLEISRTPIKSALTRLLYERIAELNSSGNIVVANITEEDVHDITIVRMRVEALAVELLENKITDYQISVLENLINKYSNVIENKGIEEMLECDYQFHTTIAEFTGNEFLIDTIRNANNIIKVYLMLSGTYEKYSIVANEEHKMVVDYMRNGDFKRAKEAMAGHLDNVSHRMLIK